MITRSKLFFPTMGSRGQRTWKKEPAKRSMSHFTEPEEYAIIHPNAKETAKQLHELKHQYRPNLHILQSNDNRLSGHSCYWYLANHRFVLDSSPLDLITNAPNRDTTTESIPQRWNNLIKRRIHHNFELKIEKNRENVKNNFTLTHQKQIQQQSHPYEKELNAAMSVISRNCFMSRSYQYHFFQGSTNSVKKKDKTVVTLVDFATQAMIIEKLSLLFPEDKFIAEEDSSMLKENAKLCEDVLQYIRIATNDLTWDRAKLFHYLDLGSFEGDVSNERVWALDPIDGTKGFVSNLHFCLAIVLLDRGKPQISVIGCPNLNVFHILERKGQASMIEIDENIVFDNMKEMDSIAPPSSSLLYPQEPVLPEFIGFPFHDRGSLYYSVTDHGAFARSLTMPLGESFKVSVSNNSKLSESSLCEASETSRHDHLMTKSVASFVKMQSDYIRLHSQCKYCIVGAGGAEGTIRYPPRGYVEKVWDHAAGAHFIMEAGGIVTDLNGFELEMNIGRNLDHHVRGIIASNGKVHNQLRYAVHVALEP